MKKNILLLIAYFAIPQALPFNKQKEDEIKAIFLTGAIGDALGAIVEFEKNVSKIEKQFPHGIESIDDVPKNAFYKIHGEDKIPITDDTEMARCVFDALLQAKKNEKEKCCNYTSKEIASQIAFKFIEEYLHNPYGWAYRPRSPGLACIKNIEANIFKLLEFLKKSKKENHLPQELNKLIPDTILTIRKFSIYDAQKILSEKILKNKMLLSIMVYH